MARFGQPGSTSQHSVDHWGDTAAIDLFPDGMVTATDRQRALRCAKLAGASGIGLYPQARMGRRTGMLHLDVRHVRPGAINTPENPALWSGWRKRFGSGWHYRDISEALF